MEKVPYAVRKEATAQSKRMERWLWAALLVAVGSLIGLNAIWIAYFFG